LTSFGKLRLNLGKPCARARRNDEFGGFVAEDAAVFADLQQFSARTAAVELFAATARDLQWSALRNGIAHGS